MYAQLSQSRSHSTLQLEPQISENSVNISSNPKKATSTACSEAAGQAVYQLFARPRKDPRKDPRHHFWRNPCSFNTLILFGDLLLTLAPCLFLILSLLAISVNKEPVSSSRGQWVEQAAKLGPTFFPVIFAAVVGRLMRTYALWRAERGASLGILEQLNGSQNLLGAFERAIRLPGLGFLSIVVVLLWALSPIGGQSALRVLSRKSLSTSNTTIIYYFNNTTPVYGGGVWDGVGSIVYYESAMNAIFQASLISLERVRGRDIWGNIKVPVLQYVPSYIAGQSKDGWYGFDENDYDSPYSALTGIVVSGLEKDKETTFIMESSYFNLTCTEPVFFDQFNASSGWQGLETWVGTLVLRGNDSSKLFSGRHPEGVWTSYMIDSNYISTQNIDFETRYNVIYASRGISAEVIAAYNCTVGLFHVENEVTCAGDCHVNRLRPSRHTTWFENGWPWLCSSASSPARLLGWLDAATAQKGSGEISAIDFYLRGYDSPYLPESPYAISYHNVSGLNFAKRFQSLINTGWQLGFQTPATAQKPSENKTALILSNDSLLSKQNSSVSYQTSATNATTIKKHDVFATNMVWLTVTMIVSLILLICGFVSMGLKYGTNSPDILGYVSSMTRDNPNFEQIPDGDRLDGLERARVLRHMKVQIVDARPWDADGHITLKKLGPTKT